MKRAKELATDFLVTLSLSNLLFFKQWSDLTRPATPWRFEAISAYATTYGALVSAVLALSLVLWIPFLVLRGKNKSTEPLYFGLLGLFFVGLNSVRGGVGAKLIAPGAILTYFPKPIGILICLIALAVGVFLIFRQRRYLPSFLRAVFLAILPVVIVTCGNAFLKLSRMPAEVGAPATEKKSDLGRVVWVIFDMWDYRLTFEERTPDLKLPNMDALKKEAFSGTQVQPPGSWTPLSIPSYLYGRSVHEFRYSPDRRGFVAAVCGPSNQLLLREHRSVFSNAHARGAKTAIVGWHLPYCQMFGKDADYCDRFPVHNELKTAYSPEFVPSFMNFLRELTFLSQSQAHTHLEHFQKIRELAMQRAADPDLNLVYVHWPIPHDPYLYDRDRGTISLKGNRIQTYWDNLALADEVLGEMRLSLEKAGLWDKSTVIVTSDHSATRRKLNGRGDTVVVSSDLSRQVIPGRAVLDTRIPYLLKLPNQKDELLFEKPFNSIVTYDLVNDFLDKKINDKVALASNIEARQEQSRLATNCMEDFQLDGGLP